MPPPQRITALLSALALVSVASFAPRAPSAASSSSAVAVLRAKKKGFGADRFSTPKPKSAAKIEKERAASAYDAAKASGVPEYRVFVREAGGDWLPVGCVTVPRSESVDQSIFGNEAALVDAVGQASVSGVRPRAWGGESPAFPAGTRGCAGRRTSSLGRTSRASPTRRCGPRRAARPRRRRTRSSSSPGT